MAPRRSVVSAILLLAVAGSHAKKLALDAATSKLVTCYQDNNNSFGDLVSVRCNPKGAPQTVISFSALKDDPNAISCSQDEEGRFPDTVYCEHDNGHFKYTLHEGGGISVQSVGGGTSVVNGGGNVVVNNVGGGGGVDSGLGTRGGFGSRRRRPSKDSKYKPVEAPVVNVPPVVIPPVNIPPVNIPPVNIPPVNIPPVNVPAVNIPAVNVPAVNVPAVNVPSTSVPSIEVRGGGTPAPDVETFTRRYYTPYVYSPPTSYYTPYVYSTPRSYYSGYSPNAARRPGPERPTRVYSARSGGSGVFNMQVDGNDVRVVRGGGSAVITVNVDGRRVSAIITGAGNRIISGYLPGVDMEDFFDNILQSIDK